MKLFSMAGAILLSLASVALADAHKATPGRDLAELIFGSFEGDQADTADMGQFVAFGKDIFVSMDYDEDGTIDSEEFGNWDFGFNFIAEDSGEQRAFETAQKVIFAIWDQDANGQIDKSEYNKSMVVDFRRADTNDDAFLSREEFLSGYIVVLAYRAAIIGE